MNLRLEVSEEIYKESFKKFDLFKKINNKSFLAFISSRLKQQLFPESTYFYQKGDLIDNFYFSIKGVGAFVMAEMNNEMFAVIDPVNYIPKRRSKRQIEQVHQFFGAEDLVINVAAICHDLTRKESDFRFSKNGFRLHNRRYFSVQSIQQSEVLTLSFQDIDYMKRDFPFSSNTFF